MFLFIVCIIIFLVLFTISLAFNLLGLALLGEYIAIPFSQTAMTISLGGFGASIGIEALNISVGSAMLMALGVTSDCMKAISPIAENKFSRLGNKKKTTHWQMLRYMLVGFSICLAVYTMYSGAINKQVDARNNSEAVQAVAEKIKRLKDNIVLKEESKANIDFKIEQAKVNYDSALSAIEQKKQNDIDYYNRLAGVTNEADNKKYPRAIGNAKTEANKKIEELNNIIPSLITEKDKLNQDIQDINNQIDNASNESFTAKKEYKSDNALSGVAFIVIVALLINLYIEYAIFSCLSSASEIFYNWRSGRAKKEQVLDDKGTGLKVEEQLLENQGTTLQTCSPFVPTAFVDDLGTGLEVEKEQVLKIESKEGGRREQVQTANKNTKINATIEEIKSDILSGACACSSSAVRKRYSIKSDKIKGIFDDLINDGHVIRLDNSYYKLIEESNVISLF